MFPAIGKTEDPLIYANHLQYTGAFRVPRGNVGFSYGGSVIAYNKANDSLFIATKEEGEVAEISIPQAINSPQISDLNTAVVLQNITDITEGNIRNIGEEGANIPTGAIRLGGMVVLDDLLVGTAFHFYDAGGETKLSHFKSGLNLSATGDFQGMFQVGNPPETPTSGFVSGWLSTIPSNWQSSLGGVTLTGNGTLSIISRTSFGPAAFSFNPSELSHATFAQANPLMYYDSKHPSLGENNSTNSDFNGTTKIGGMVMIDGTRTVLYFGYHGTSRYVYGHHSPDPMYADVCTEPDLCTQGPMGWSICADPLNCTTGRRGIPFDPVCSGSGKEGCYYDPSGIGAKGPHAFPYVHKVWAYDANDFVEAKAGLKEPWEVLPYAIWTMPSIFHPSSPYGGPAAYDKDKKLLFISQPSADLVGCCEKLPLIHVFKVDTTIPPNSAYAVTGVLTLLDGTVTLLNNGQDPITITSDNRTEVHKFSFPQKIPTGASYEVTVQSQPEGVYCRVYNSSGTIHANANIGDIAVMCTNEPFVLVQYPAPPKNLGVVR